MHTLFAILQVAAGLGFVIFVHELGHFLVAKACGVRCDKFMIGFDIGGLKLSRKWGETEYGIGILPLGGYVKMFGQEDNAGAIAEEIEASKAMEGSPDAKEVMGPDGKKVWVHKRSYMAKSVPQRMAIISAGVIMNVIFAVVMAFIAYGIGVPETPATVGSTLAGGPAWQAGLRTGDRLTRIGDIQNPTYKQLRETVILGDIEKGIETEVLRTDGSTEQITLHPVIEGLVPQIGAEPSLQLRLAQKNAVQPNTPAGEAGEKGFHGGDEIVEVGGQPVTNFAEMLAVLLAEKENPVDFTVVRGGKAPLDNPVGPLEGGERVTFTIDANPMERLGIVPTLGPIVAIENGSPAEAAGLKVGDQIVAIDGEKIGAAPEGETVLDPVTLDDRLATAATEDAKTTISYTRDGETLEVEVTPRLVTWRSTPGENSPWPIESIGVACEMRAEVAAIEAGSPAASADLRPGDVIVSAMTKSKSDEDTEFKKPLEFGKDQNNWPALLMFIQDNSPDFEVVLEVSRPNPTQALSPEQIASPTHTVTLKPYSSDKAYWHVRGFRPLPLKEMRVAKDMREQAELAFSETGSALMSVVRFLQKLGGQVSVKALGGPITIAQVAGEAAFEGVGALLMSLVMLSANLAVLNFLPIPVLDGGHMVFLAYEGITGRPVNEKVAIALQTVGLLLLLSLMLFVTSMDISRLVTSLF